MACSGDDEPKGNGGGVGDGGSGGGAGRNGLDVGGSGGRAGGASGASSGSGGAGGAGSAQAGGQAGASAGSSTGGQGGAGQAGAGQAAAGGAGQAGSGGAAQAGSGGAGQAGAGGAGQAGAGGAGQAGAGDAGQAGAGQAGAGQAGVGGAAGEAGASAGGQAGAGAGGQAGAGAAGAAGSGGSAGATVDEDDFPLIGPPGGGGTEARACNAGDVVVGFKMQVCNYAYYRPGVVQFQTTCAPVLPRTGAGPISLGTPYDSVAVGATSPGSVMTALCPTDQVVVGIDARLNQTASQCLSNIGVTCAPLTKDASGKAVPGSPQAGPATAQTGAQSGPNVQTCSPGLVATGTPTSWGQVMNAIALHCTRVLAP